MDEEQLQNILDNYDLPNLPDETDETDDIAEIVIFRQNKENIPLERLITVQDAQEYCSREDTHGPGWFAGFYRR